MPEEQKPYVHQDGSTTPAAAPAVDLSPHALANLINHMTYARGQNALGDPRTRAARQEPYDQVIAILRLLRRPDVNSALVAIDHLDPVEASAVVDVATAMMALGAPQRPKLMRALRVALEIRS